MERDKPAAADLLKIARSLLREELLAHLPEAQKLNGLMIANAMAIAAGELEIVPGMEEEVGGSLRAFYPGMETATLSELCNRFAGDIRKGHFDDDESAYSALLANSRKRIAISNPRYLAASES